MCGICGALQLGGGPLRVFPSETLARMTDAMAHRGPDDRGVFLAEGIALGVRRLSIVDVEHGGQPFASEDGQVVAVQNGELYNQAEVRASLARAHVLRTRCDTEVLPHLYEEHGTAFPERLRGMFGIAVWDARLRRLVLARDRFGKKPLYYARSGDLLLFASELKSLLASGLVSAELGYEAIEAYLSLGFFPAPATPLAAVSKLPPGHVLVADRGGVSVAAYWEVPAYEPVPASIGDAQERVFELLDESVRLRLMSDVPLGAMLSGGLDSSLVVALMARHTAQPVETFSVGFVESGGQNELEDARLVASAFGTRHRELELSLLDSAVDLAQLVWHLDEPLADLSALGLLALCELAARHVKVVLSGQGADEVFGGYASHRRAAAVAAWKRLPRPLRAGAELAAAHGPARVRTGAAALRGDAVSRYLLAQRTLDEPLRAELVRGLLAAGDGGAARRAVARLGELPRRPLDAALALDMRLGLADDMLHYFDRASMAHSLEVRVPFLDHHLVEYCATLPASMKVRGLTTKWLLKRVARGVLPAQIVDKPKIGFFSGALDAWFAAQAEGAVADYLLAAQPRYPELLNRACVERLAAAHAAGDRRHGRLLLAILMLEVWLSTFLPRATTVAQPARERVLLPT
jgi:asparagine synthase (glutamine-hydrolysing)